MGSMKLEDWLVSEILATWPETVRVFNRFRLACPGCAMAPFMTVKEACESYGLECETFVAALRRGAGLGERS